MTKYVVLYKPIFTDDKASSSSSNVDYGWREAGKTEAASSNAAIRAVAGVKGNGQYAAIPVRSFKSRVVKVEQTTKVELS